MTPNLRLLLLGALAAASAGCEQENIAKLTAKANFMPNPLEFGDVTIGDRATRTTALKNGGTGVFTIEHAEITGPFAISGPAEGLEGKAVAPGGSLAVDVGFLAAAVGDATGTLTVSGGGVTASVDLHGVGVERPVANLAIAPTSLDFGTVEVGTEATKDVTITNSGTAQGVIDRVTLQSTSAEVTASDEYRPNHGLPIAVDPGQSVTVPIVFHPSAEGSRADVMSFSTSGGAPLQVALTGEGKITRGEMACDPAALDFGQVQRGQSRQLQTTCTVSGGPVRFASAAIAAASDPYFSVLNPPGTADLNAGDTITVTVVYAPDGAPATNHGTLEVGYSGERGASTVQVALTGENTAPPAGDLVCNPAALAFGQVERGQSRQLQTVCTANGGPAHFAGASLHTGTAQYFTLPSSPAAADLTAGDTVMITVNYAPDGLPTTHQGTLDVAYTNDRGSSTVSIPLTGEVVPPPPTATAISLILRWDTADSDVDIHLTRPNAIPFSPLGGDCFYANMNPDWGTQSDTTDNPFLDRDDINGPGPENLNLGVTAAGNYRVLAHYFSDHTHGPTTATVEVYVAGNLAGTFTHQLSCNDLWNVGTVNWNGTSGTFAPTNTVSQDSHGSCR